jgi:hypothetical protein
LRPNLITDWAFLLENVEMFWIYILKSESTDKLYIGCKVPDGLIKNAKWIDNNFLPFSQDAKNLSDLLIKISGG